MAAITPKSIAGTTGEFYLAVAEFEFLVKLG